MFFAGWVLIYANRLVLSSSMKAIQAEWQMSKTALGLITSAFFVSYTVMQVPSGYLGDRFSRKLVLVAGYCVHALGALLSGYARTAATFMAMRVLTGLGQSTYYSNEYAIAGSEIPDRYRASGMAVINSGMSVGIILGLVAGGLGAGRAQGSWRMPFIVLGAITALLALTMQLLIKKDVKKKLINNREEQDTGGSSMVSSVPCYGLALISMYGFYLLLTWLPFYLVDVRGMEMLEASLVSCIVPVVSIPFSVAGGWFSDRIGSRRKILIAVLPLSALCFLMIPQEGIAWLVAGLVLYGVTGKLTVDPLLVAYVADALPKSQYATAFGILNFASAIGTVTAPAITGMLADLTGSFNAGFYLAFALQLMAWAFAMLMPERRCARGQ